MMKNEALLEQLKELPQEPGIYKMKDATGSIIYIGKASSIKKRVSSYFQKQDQDPKTKLLVKAITDIEYIVTDSEIEALLLENNLIKKHKPKYNIRLKDDKRYPYIAVTLTEDYPRVIYTRKLIDNGNKYFGPFTDAKAAKNVIALTNNIFKLKMCKRDLPLKKHERPCLNYQLKRCCGPCMGEVSQEEYLEFVNGAVGFLDGAIEPVIKKLQDKMVLYSENMHYEKASLMRDMIFDIQKISSSQKVYAPLTDDQDYITTTIYGKEALLINFEFRKGALLGRKIQVFDNAEYSDESDIIQQYIIEYYEKNEPPSLLITPFVIKDKKIIETYLSESYERTVHIKLPSSEHEKGIIALMRKNIDLLAMERKSSQQKRERISGLEELKKVLFLDEVPEIIECFDISNLQGTDAVASMVLFRSGLPENKSYRRYKIKGYDSANDPAMMHEVVSRRMQYLINEEQELPDIMVIDGGKTQLAKALEAVHNFTSQIKVISLAKKQEEIFYDIDEGPIHLPLDNPAITILTHIRDEAHRFAITYHRTLRDKKTTHSELDNIKGISDSTKSKLLKHFKSIDAIKTASIEDLTAVSGVGEKIAHLIVEYFKKNS